MTSVSPAENKEIDELEFVKALDKRVENLEWHFSRDNRCYYTNMTNGTVIRVGYRQEMWGTNDSVFVHVIESKNDEKLEGWVFGSSLENFDDITTFFNKISKTYKSRKRELLSETYQALLRA